MMIKLISSFWKKKRKKDISKFFHNKDEIVVRISIMSTIRAELSWLQLCIAGIFPMGWSIACTTHSACTRKNYHRTSQNLFVLIQTYSYPLWLLWGLPVTLITTQSSLSAQHKFANITCIQMRAGGGEGWIEIKGCIMSSSYSSLDVNWVEGGMVKRFCFQCHPKTFWCLRQHA